MPSQETGLSLLLVFATAFAGCVSPPCMCPSARAASPAAVAPTVARKVERPALAAPVPADWRPYVIRPGDTLAMIAACRDVELGVLARANDIAWVDFIEAGSTLRVPPVDLCEVRRQALARRRAKPAEATAVPAVAVSPAVAAAPDGDARARAEFARGQRLLAAARARYDAADFSGSLRDADAAASAFARAASHPDASARRARAHVVAGIAAVGLEQPERALAELRRAVSLDPQAALENEDRSPRLVELFRVARETGSVGAQR
jgi:hypothetical protein